MAKVKNNRKVRGKFLGIYLVGAIVLSILGFIPIDGFNGLYVFGLIMSVIALALYGLIWQWRRAGVYAYIAFCVISYLVCMPLAFFNKDFMGIAGFGAVYFLSIVSVIDLGLFIWAVSRKWKYFN